MNLGACAPSCRATASVESFYGEIGRRYTVAPRTTMTPFLGLTVAHDNVDGFTESDPSGSGAALKVGSASGNSLASNLGARVEAQWGAWTPEVSVAWEHEFLNPVLSVTNSLAAAPGVSFTELSSNPGSDWALVSVGTTYTFNPSNAFTLKYDGASQALTAPVQWSGAGTCTSRRAHTSRPKALPAGDRRHSHGRLGFPGR